MKNIMDVQMFEKLRSAGETVEVMILENNGRTIRRDGELTKEGPILYDPMLNESYVITEKPLLAYRKKKSVPVYLVDRDSGVTVIMEKVQGEGVQSVDLKIPDGTEPISSPDAPGARPPGVFGSLFRPEPERLIFRDPGEVIIDGKRFAGWTVRMERSEQIIRLNTDPSLVGRGIASPLIGMAFSPPLSNQQKLVMILVGLVAGILVGLMF